MAAERSSGSRSILSARSAAPSQRPRDLHRSITAFRPHGGDFDLGRLAVLAANHLGDATDVAQVDVLVFPNRGSPGRAAARRPSTRLAVVPRVNACASAL